ncbi:MAG: hypothetical protein CMP03_04190 [Woeseiaceae bacterium]|nr:hypothetical protein [Woeseiaceae bacterium]
MIYVSFFYFNKIQLYILKFHLPKSLIKLILIKIRFIILIIKIIWGIMMKRVIVHHKLDYSSQRKRYE